MPARDRDDIGQIELVLLIVVAQLRERSAQQRRMDQVNAGVDLTNRKLRRRRVAGLDDGGDVAPVESRTTRP